MSAAGPSLRLLCSECGASVGDDAIFCAQCQGLAEFVLENGAPSLGPSLRRTFLERRMSSAPLDRSGVWRFRDLLPPIDPARVVTLRENELPLYDAPRSAQFADIEAVAALHLGMNPTASFKDAGMTAAISHANASGARVVICASTGNTSASMAAYAARANLAAVVLVPRHGVSEAKIAQTLDYGPTVVGIAGDFDRALEIVRAQDPRRVAIVNSVNPYRIEGQKCAAFALLELREWRVPDWVVLPGGNLGNTTAFGKGFREALALGLIDRLPRIAVVQAAGAAPFVRVVQEGGELVPVQAQTSATAIKIGAPASWKKALRVLRECDGTAVAVDDEEIAQARATIGRDGIGCEPASAASLAGLRRLRQSGVIGRDEDVVIVLTGHVLKDPNYTAQYHASGAPLANRIVDAPDDAALRDLIERLATREPARV